MPRVIERCQVKRDFVHFGQDGREAPNSRSWRLEDGAQRAYCVCESALRTTVPSHLGLQPLPYASRDVRNELLALEDQQLVVVDPEPWVSASKDRVS